jgi:hypothetical protein
MPTDFEAIFLFDLSSHRKIFAESISQGNIRWKIVSCDRTCTHDGDENRIMRTVKEI